MRHCMLEREGKQIPKDTETETGQAQFLAVAWAYILLWFKRKKIKRSNKI